MVAGQRYASAEQFMMSEKATLFGDAEIRAQILASEDPSEAKRLGRGVRGFDNAVWEKARFDLVTVGNLAKFGDDKRLKEYLVETGDDILVEASPTDPCGLHKRTV